MQILKKLLRISLLFFIAILYHQQIGLAKNTPTQKTQDLSVKGNLTVAGTSLLEGPVDITNNLNIQGGNLSIFPNNPSPSTSSSPTPYFSVNPTALTYTGQQFTFNGSNNLPTSKYTINVEKNQTRNNTAFSGSKTVKAHRALNPTIFTLTFGEYLGETAESVAQGIIYEVFGLVTGFADDYNLTEIIYQGTYYILPGASDGDPCTITTLSESSTAGYGTPFTATTSVSGTGLIANVILNFSEEIYGFEVTFSYGVQGPNAIAVS